MNIVKDKKSSSKTYGYEGVPKKKPFVLPPGCTLALLTHKQFMRMNCQDGAGVKVLCSPGGLPVVRQYGKLIGLVLR